MPPHGSNCPQSDTALGGRQLSANTTNGIRGALTVADAHSADEPGDGCGVKDVPDHAVCLALVEAALGAAGDDAAGVLAAVLEEGEAFADLSGRIDGRVVEEEA